MANVLDMAGSAAPGWRHARRFSTLWLGSACCGATGTFGRLWTGNTISLTGDAISGIALPLVADHTLHATAFEVGVLTAVVWVPQLLFGLPAGVWMDRVRRRPVMIAGDWAGRSSSRSCRSQRSRGLAMWLLVCGRVVMGMLSMFFRLGWAAYLPSTVPRDRLVEGTSTLEAAGTAVGIAGPGLGGLLVQALTAPVALLVDAASFLVSAVNLTRIRTREQAPQPSTTVGMRAQLAEGFRFVRGQRVLRILVVFVVLVSVVFAAQQALLLLFLARSVGLAPRVIGVLFALAAIGGFIGALMTPAVGRRIGTGRTFCVAAGVTFPFGLLIPLTTNGAGAMWYVLGAGVVAAGIAATNITALSFLLAICPNDLLGRVSAVANVTQTAGLVIGGLVGGVLGTFLGVPTSMWFVEGGLVVVAALVIASPLRHVRNLPTEPATGSSAPTLTTGA